MNPAIRSKLLRGGWILGTLFLLASLWFLLWHNRASSETLSAVTPLGSVLVALYAIFVLSEKAPRWKDLLLIILAADFLLFTEAARFISQADPAPDPKEITVTFMWDEKTGEMFPPGTVVVSKIPWSYASAAERIVRDCLAHYRKNNPDKTDLSAVSAPCGLLPGYDLAEVVLLEHLGWVFQNSWEAKRVKVPTFYGKRQHIKKHGAGRVGRVLSRDDVLRIFSHNPMVQFLSADFQLTLPPDVDLKAGKGAVRGQSAFSYLLFDGHYCDLLILVQGGLAGAKYPNWDSNVRMTEVDICLLADCSRWSRGHPEIASRIDWADRLIETVEMELSNETIGAKR